MSRQLVNDPPFPVCQIYMYVLEKSYMHAVGTKNDVEAFADHSRLFEREGYATSEDIDRILNFGEEK